jgi:hypothetical protein
MRLRHAGNRPLGSAQARLEAGQAIREGTCEPSHRRLEQTRRAAMRLGIENSAVRRERAGGMAEGIIVDGPEGGLTEHLKDALLQVYQEFLEAHPGEVSPAAARRGVIAATAKMLVTIHGHASPDEEALVSWEAYKNGCLAELDRIRSEPQDASGEDSR